VKLGIENRKQVVALAVLSVIAVIAVITMGHALWPSGPPAPTASSQKAPANPARTNAPREPSGKVASAAGPRLDPTLDLDLLRRSEEIKYAGSGRNIFVAGSIPTPVAPGVTDRRKPGHPEPRPLPVIQPPPPINLKFYGYASKPGEPKKVFLSQGDDIFVAGECDIIDRRYRILRISPLSVDVEDVLNNNRQSIPLTQG